MAGKRKFMSEKEAWSCVILHEDGQSFETIGKKLGKHPTAVSRVFKRYQETGSPLRGKRSYPKQATTPEEDAAIINYSQNHPLDPASKIKERLNLEASLTTIKSRLRANGVRKPRLTKQNKDVLSSTSSAVNPRSSNSVANTTCATSSVSNDLIHHFHQHPQSSVTRVMSSSSVSNHLFPVTSTAPSDLSISGYIAPSDYPHMRANNISYDWGVYEK